MDLFTKDCAEIDNDCTCTVILHLKTCPLSNHNNYKCYLQSHQPHVSHGFDWNNS